ncbi:hypothetical protein ABB07_38360 [Streptomyces incarnatus]|uniref:Uncharacterized protein n=1 Tax=Streptomyces incarnatus TaxID=665007 RepID=A0ABN4GPI2_9ACTN|nr:hypothetical protein ABB07_38360 [Streptomyces incarnatus]
MGQQLPCDSVHRVEVLVLGPILTLEQLLGCHQKAGDLLRRVSIRAHRVPAGQFENESLMSVPFGESPDGSAQGEPNPGPGSNRDDCIVRKAAGAMVFILRQRLCASFAQLFL